MDNTKNKKYNTLQPLILAACIAVGMMVGFKLNEKPDGKDWQWIEQKENEFGEGRVEQMLRFIDSKYVENIDDEDLTAEAIKAILEKLDPYSVYMSPEDTQLINDDMNGAYVGIGVENYYFQDTVQISRVIPNSPASLAGLKPYDKLISINDVAVAGQNLEYNTIKQLLSQKIGEKLSIKILRDYQPMTIEIVVNEIVVKSVQSKHLKEIGASYVKINKFGAQTYKEFMEEIEVLFGEKKSQHLILDLRDNPGGYLPEAINILCQIFEEKDKLLLYTEGRNNKKNEYKSTGKRFFDIQNIVVLIDENSASASEIIAGAIQDWDRGIVIGRRSYGKGMVQEQYALNNGGAIRLTVAKYFTPSGRCIQRDFQDRELFEREVDLRFKSGEMFNADSLKKSISEPYLSKLYQRPLYGEGGITPDIFIPLPSQLNDPEYFKIKYLISEFVYHQMKIKNGTPSELNPFLSWSLPQKFYDDFTQYSEKSYGEKVDWPQLKNYEILFKNEIAQKVLSENDHWTYLLKNDAALIKAISVIQQNLRPKDLIPKKK